MFLLVKIKLYPLYRLNVMKEYKKSIHPLMEQKNSKPYTMNQHKITYYLLWVHDKEVTIDGSLG
jgi:hypothetical protein